MPRVETDEPGDVAVQQRVYTVAARWTEKLVQRGFTTISDTFLENYARLKITSAEAMLVVHLLSFKWDKRHPYPSLATLAKRMGMSPTAVRNHARSLEQKGYLHRVKRQGNTNEFDLTPLFNTLEAFVE